MLFLWLLLAAVNAISIGRGILRIDETNFDFKDTPTLNLTDSRLSLGFTLLDEKKGAIALPEHVAVALSGPKTGSRQYFSPRLIENKVYEFAVPISSISPWLLSGEFINVEIITGDTQTSAFNSVFVAATVDVSAKLQQSINLVPVNKHEPKAEIHHQFKEAPKSMLFIIITQFMVEITLALALLIAAWLYTTAWNVENASNVSPLTYAFISTIGAFHYVIFDYFKQASIFQTVGRMAILTPLAVYFGAKSLKSIYKLQTAGLR